MSCDPEDEVRVREYERRQAVLTGKAALEACRIPLEPVIQLMKEEPNPNLNRQQRRQQIRAMEAYAARLRKRGI